MALARRAPGQPPLPPGFRFCPTDGELVLHYLRRRAHGVPLPAEVDIPEVRILQHDPSDLLPPGWAEPERYFFTCKEAKYVKGRRANRATGAGYWKATGKEKPVEVTFAGAQQQPVLVGMKRSLVFYRGRPPTGTKTDWVMHEYRLAGACLQPSRRGAAPPAEGWVLCRVFNKKRAAGGPGSAAAADAYAAAAPEEEQEQEQEEMEMEEAVVDEETEDEKEAEEDDKAAAAAPAASGFIDFFARAEGSAQQQQQQQGPPGAASPVVSSSCVTDQ